MSSAQRSEIRDGIQIDWDVPIRMDDGLVLRADVLRPPHAARCPVLLTYGPYAKGLAFQDGYPSAWQRMVAEHPDVAYGSSNLYQSWEVVDPEKWVPHGYACVRVDSRGAGRSPGIIDHFSPRETRDFYNCIEWAGVQPWSSGKVGLNGISYYAMNQWHVATLQPPHLTAMCIWEGSADWYRDMTHHGGILSSFWANWYDMQVKTVQYGLGERGPRSRVTGELACGDETLSDAELAENRSDFGDDILAHPLDDQYHRDRSPVWEKVVTPFLSAANWGGQGLHPRGNFEGFVRAAAKNKWLEAHGIEHWTHFYTDYGRLLQKRFFDFFLKMQQEGIEAARKFWGTYSERNNLFPDALEMYERMIDFYIILGFVPRVKYDEILGENKSLKQENKFLRDTIRELQFNLFTEGGEKVQQIWHSSIDKQLEMNKEIAKNFFELFRQLKVGSE